MWKNTRDSSAKKKVEKLINKLLWTNNQDAIEKYNEGIKLLKRKKKEEALDSFRQASMIDSSFLAPKFELGMNAYNSGDEGEAQRYLSDIAYKIPYYAEIQLILGNINYRNRNYRSAAENFSSVINYGFISSYLQYTTTIKRGNCYYNTGEFDKAENDIEKAQKYKKNNLDSLILLSAIHIKKQDYDKALSTLERAEKLSHKNPVILFQTGSIYYHKKNWKYVSYFDRLFDITDKENKDSINLYDKAFKILMSSHFENKHYSRAQTIAEALIKNNNDYEALLIIARSSFYLNKFQECIDTFEKLSLNSSDRFLLSIAYARTGMKDKSKETLKYIIGNSELKQKAEKNRYLKPLILEIEKDQSQNNTSQSFQQQ